MTDEIDLQEFVGGFVAESDELVVLANASLATIQASATPRPRAVRDLFRALHTIKGLAAMIGVEPIAEIAHALETLLRAADRAGGELDASAVASCVEGVDAIAQRVRAVAERRPVAKAPARLVDLVANIVVDKPPSSRAAVSPEWESKLSTSERAQLAQAWEASSRVWTVSFLPSDDRAAGGVTIGSVRRELAELGDIIKVVPRTLAQDRPGAAGIAFDILMVSDADPDTLARRGGTTTEHVRELVRPEPAAIPEIPNLDVPDDVADAPALGRSFVRVEVARLDTLQDQLSNLIVSRFRIQREIARLADHGTDVRALRDVVEVQARQLRDLRRAILQARLVRASEIFEPLSLLVRSLARANDKAVDLEIDAGSAELDKSVADRLLPALVHLVRNAVDHAIETPAERTALGKPPAGQLTVICREVANRITVTVSDDGRGIDRDAIARAANRPIGDDAALLDVLTRAGFSTRATATKTSGRGVGMDIVRRVITGELGGELAVTTNVGLGTTFTLRVPVTIAVLDVFTFHCGGQAFVTAVGGVEEIFEFEPEALVTPPGQSVSLLERRGRAISVISLGRLLALDDGSTARKALLIRRNNEEVAFTVDQLAGRQEVVIRPIEDPLVRSPGISGATDLGDGRPTLVLDLAELCAISKVRA